MDHNNLRIPVHLIDHSYILPVQRPIVQINGPHLDDHGYALPAVYQDLVADEVDDVPDQVGDVPVAPDQGDDAPIVPDQVDVVPDEEFPVPVIGLDIVETYTMLPGIRRNTKIYVDNLGYKYYQKKVLTHRLSLICERQKNPSRPMCHGTASVSRFNEMDNRIVLGNPHNHEPAEIDLQVPFLRNTLSEKSIDPTITSTSIRTLYNSEIVKWVDFNVSD